MGIKKRRLIFPRSSVTNREHGTRPSVLDPEFADPLRRPFLERTSGTRQHAHDPPKHALGQKREARPRARWPRGLRVGWRKDRALFQ